MNISLQDIKGLGYQKIYSNYDKVVLRGKVEQLNTLLCGVKIQPYSFMGCWSSIKDMHDVDANGIKRLVLSTEPLISSVEPSAAVKRKFRNTWNSIWDKYGEVNALSAYEVSLLNDAGLKLCIFLSAYTLSDEKALKKLKNIDIDLIDICSLDILIQFYNAVINWYCLTQFENILSVQSKSLLDLIGVLALSDNEDFVTKLSFGVNVWD